MGNSATKESRQSGTRSRAGSHRQDPASGSHSPSAGDRSHVYSSRNGRGSRPDLSFLHISGRERDSDREARSEVRRETKQEREARKTEKERVAREKERERSTREEGVDGGYLVTLGTYTGTEDYSKPVVRQLMIERRLAPFWKGLNDHSDSWAEHQLVAAAQGLPIPAADEIPPEMERRPSQAMNPNTNINGLTIPIESRSESYHSDRSANLSPSHPAFSNAGPSSLPSASTSAPLFRGRAKTFASLGTSSKSGLSTQITPQEIQLPKDAYVNGLRLEAILYKDASECPICFLYYPPYLNRTRCCDQAICSECFVQIKRPDPHPPEHHEDGSQPPEPKPAEEEDGLLVSEPSACPFCVTPEFGVTYDPPPFRRGLAYAGPASGNPLSNPTSAMSSSTSLNVGSLGQARRRTTSLSVTAPAVITTDRVRPDWAKKLADARAHALRRSAAATALHNAAYMLGSSSAVDSRGLGFGRRRRTLLAEDGPASGSRDGVPLSSLSALLADRNEVSQMEGTRRNRINDLEELMMMEAIRLSLAAEDDRKRKEDKENKKEEKKKAKEAKKAEKTAEKTAKKSGGLYSVGGNDSSSNWSSSMPRSSSNLNVQSAASSASSPPAIQGKGKSPINANATVGFNPLSEPTSTLNTENTASSSSIKPFEDPQRHLEASRANLQQPSQPIAFTDHSRSHMRHLSNTSSIASSLGDSAPTSYRRGSEFGVSPNASGLHLDAQSHTPEHQSGTPSNGAGLEPMLNFRSLAAMIGQEDKGRAAEHVEYVEHASPSEQSAMRKISIASNTHVVDNEGRGEDGGSSGSGAHLEGHAHGNGAYQKIDTAVSVTTATGNGQPPQ